MQRKSLGEVDKWYIDEVKQYEPYQVNIAYKHLERFAIGHDWAARPGFQWLTLAVSASACEELAYNLVHNDEAELSHQISAAAFLVTLAFWSNARTVDLDRINALLGSNITGISEGWDMVRLIRVLLAQPSYWNKSREQANACIRRMHVYLKLTGEPALRSKRQVESALLAINNEWNELNDIIGQSSGFQCVSGRYVRKADSG